jgi:quercetin dioxygenase-like cupin family protein
MIRTGDVVTNPVTGEQLRFVKTAGDTGGEAVVVEVTVEPDGFVAAAHVHPYQSERFEIVSGRVGFRLGREKLEAGPGDVVVVEPGTAHKFWNAADEPAVFVT